MLALDLARNGSRYGFMLDIPQDHTERLLRGRVSELGGVVEQGLELDSLADEPTGVTAKVRSDRPIARDNGRVRGGLRRRAQQGAP